MLKPRAGGEAAIQIREMITGLPVVYQFASEGGGIRALEFVCDQKYLVAALHDGKLLVVELNVN